MLNSVHIREANVDDAWLKWYKLFEDNKEKAGSRDGDVVAECINAITTIEDPTRCIMMNPIRKMSMRYAIGELLWYDSASNLLRDISSYTKAWERMSDDGITVNSNYGYCIKEKFGFDQMEYIKELFKKDRYTRQAVIHIKEPRNTSTKDLNCTVCTQFFIRRVDGMDRLFMTTYMRSNDFWMGFPFDVFQFTCMQIRLAMELHVGLGTYTHVAGSLHFYERDYKVAKGRAENG